MPQLRVLLVAAIGQQQQYRYLREPPREESEKLEAGIVGPVDIFGDKEEWLARAESGKQLDERLEEPPFLLLRANQRGNRASRQIGSQLWQQPRVLDGVCPRVAHQFRRGNGGEQR